MMVLAHDNFTVKPVDELKIISVSTGGEIRFTDADDPTRTHPVVDVESGSGQGFAGVFPLHKGHGARIAEAGALEEVRGSADGIIYVPGAFAQTPLSSSSTDTVSYKLISFTGDRNGDGVPDSPSDTTSITTDSDGSGQSGNTGLWDRTGDDRIYGCAREDFGLVLDPQQRQGSGNSPMPVELGHGLNGDSGCKANLPWGWFERFGSFLKEENKGDLFLDPAGYFLEPAAGKISGDGQFEDTGEAKYVWNVFLNRQVVFGGIRITEVPDKPSNFACDAEDQKCNVCLSSIRGLPDDFNKELIHGQSADCTPEEIQACRQRLTAKGIPIP